MIKGEDGIEKKEKEQTQNNKTDKMIKISRLTTYHPKIKLFAKTKYAKIRQKRRTYANNKENTCINTLSSPLIHIVIHIFKREMFIKLAKISGF